MKKILFLHSSAELYGSDRSLLNIAKYIDKEKFQVHVILPYEGPLAAELRKLHGVQVKLFELAVLRRKNLSIKGGAEYVVSFRKSCRYIKDYIRRHRIDVVYTNTSVIFPGAVAAKQTGVKSVWHVREIMKSGLENRVISAVISHYADTVVANSKETAKALKVPQNKIRVVYNASEEKENLKRAPHAHLTVGMAGRINRWKGQKLLVDAAEVVHRELSDVKFRFAGSAYTGEEYLEQELQEYIDGKGLQDVVTLCGHISDMDQFYGGLDLFVLPSVQPEPFGLVVIEAMEYGIPVIATNHGGPVEIIHDKVDGYLVDHKECTEMAQRILELLKDVKLREYLGANGQKKKRELFSVEKMVRCMEDVFTKEFE